MDQPFSFELLAQNDYPPGQPIMVSFRLHNNGPRDAWVLTWYTPLEAFWMAPMTGTDSKAGTLVHEMSHFNVVAGTDDHKYGQAACRTLATTNPDQAIDNADSHEYFAENNPALPMNAVAAPVNPMTPAWRNLPAGFAGSYDAVLNGSGPFAGKAYFFKGEQLRPIQLGRRSRRVIRRSPAPGRRM